MFICGLCKSNKHNNAMVLSQYRRIHDVKIEKKIFTDYLCLSFIYHQKYTLNWLVFRPRIYRFKEPFFSPYCVSNNRHFCTRHLNSYFHDNNCSTTGSVGFEFRFPFAASLLLKLCVYIKLIAAYKGWN